MTQTMPLAGEIFCCIMFLPVFAFEDFQQHVISTKLAHSTV